MKAVQVVARGKAEFVDVPVPKLRPGHVLVRTRRLSLCGSDIRMLHFAPEDAYPFPPGTTGHEMVGVIEAIDSPGSALQVGDTVLTLAPSHQAMAEYFLRLSNTSSLYHPVFRSSICCRLSSWAPYCLHASFFRT